MWCVSPDCRLSGRFSLVYGVWVQGVEWGHVSDLFFCYYLHLPDADIQAGWFNGCTPEYVGILQCQSTLSMCP